MDVDLKLHSQGAEAAGGLYVCSLYLNSIVFVSETNEPLLYENYFYEFILFSSYFISKIIKSPIKNTTKQNPKPAPVSPFPLP